MVSVVHWRRDAITSQISLDDEPASRISAFLLDSHIDKDPPTLRASCNVAFLGSKTQGIGFIFGDTNPSCPPLSRMQQVLELEPESKALVRPYMGGEDLNSMPTLNFYRFAIDFKDMSEDEARATPELFSVAEEFVLPFRSRKSGSLKKRWWQYGHKAEELYRAISANERVIAVARVSKSLAFSFLPSDIVFAEMLTVFALDSFSAFATLQSRIQETWTRTFASSMKDDLRYTPSDCVETFPFPESWQSDAALEAVGREYYEYRAALMVQNDEGLTATYNRFHDPHERSAEIEKLRELHAAMDRAVLAAYGWDDLAEAAKCEFLLDYEEDGG